ncbi:conserved hypothetical protein [uncultured delta proteobacterium]|uniref:Uncharacterized protein n=1 Tax=uncultured delta proteobacterium TaxID=34034 RepID=A0A212IT53_9DELT|nr:conserved hypothetical protein [uncultured delta proteobacterium]
MHDELGSYYYPNPADPRSRVYVREGDNGLEFRLWHAEYPAVWEKHGWMAQATLEKAAAMYRDMGRESNPMALYDVAVAQALVREERRRKETL